jgi:FG-GAP-like repeat/FG-GAP repeat
MKLNRLIPVVCLVGVLAYNAPAATQPPGKPQVVTPAMDVLYAAPGDLNYAYGPKGADLAALTAGDRPATATFSVTYNGFSPEAQAAFQAGINIWAATITSPAPIRIVANWTPLATGVLGSAGPSRGCTVAAGIPSTFYAAALADKINGSAFCASQAGVDREINANFNSSFTSWEFGTTGVGVPGKYNFMTVVMHEVGHGLGFLGTFSSSAGVGSLFNSQPFIYDRFAVSGGDTPLLNIARPSAALHAQLVSNNTFWSTAIGPKLETHNMTTQYGFSSDNGWMQGSSYTHLDDVRYTGTPNGLMTFRLSGNEVYTDIGPVVRTIFTNEGWTVSTTPRIAGDFDGDGSADFAVLRPSSGQWFVAGAGNTSFAGQSGDIPVPADFNGDGRTDVAVFRPSSGQWLIQGQSTVTLGRAGDIPVPGDYNGDGLAEAAVFRSTDGPTVMTWIVSGGATTAFGVRGDIAVPADYDGDGKTDLAVFRPRTAQWIVLNSSNGTTSTTSWGSPGDIPVPGKYDGDALADIAVYRPYNGTWYLRLSAGGAPSIAFGATGDVPMPLDVNGDGLAELSIFRPSDGNWYAFNRLSSTTTTLQFGAVGDIPVMQRPRLPSAPASDFDGDGVSDVTVFRPSSGTWFTKTSSSGFATSTQMQWGQNGDTRVAGDYDGDRRTDYAVYRPSTGEWFIRRSATATLLYVVWGSSGDVPVAADYDGDGRTDIAVYRPSTGSWFVLKSSTNYTTSTQTPWGIAGDLPIVGDFDGDGKADQAIYRPSTGTWIILPSTTAFGPNIVRQWGQAGDTPIAGDFDGDGRTDLNIYRPSNGTWFAEDALLASPLPNGPFGLQWGLSSDAPVPHDFDGDGLVDPTVYRPSTGEWFARRSSNGTLLLVTWGSSGDGPLLRKDGGSRP